MRKTIANKLEGGRSRWRLLVAGLFVLLTAIARPAGAAYSYDSALTWRTLETPHFAVHFHDGEDQLAVRVAAIAEGVHSRLSARLAWVPTERTDLILTDRFDVSNGWSTPLPYNTTSINVVPPDDLGLEDYDDWLELVITHEYAHTLHLDMADGPVAGLRAIFGRFPLLFPNVLQPTWLIEGLATHMETDEAQGVGRGQSSYFRALMRNEVLNGVKPVRQINTPLLSWPGGSAPYLYGVYFYRFVAVRYGEEQAHDLAWRYSRNLVPFMINTNSRRVLGQKMPALWAEFERFVTAEFQAEIAAIGARGTRVGERLTDTGFLTGAPFVLPNGDLFYVQDNQSDENWLMYQPTGGKPRRIALVRSSRFDVHSAAGIVLCQLEVDRNANYYSDLYRIEVPSGRVRRLTAGGRYRFATWSPDGRRVLAVHYALGEHSLQVLDANGTVLETLWRGTEGEVIAAPDWSPDGTSVVAARWRRGGGWDLALFDIEQRRWDALVETDAVEMQPRFTPDGAAVVYTADYGGIYNVQRVALGERGITTLTNVLGAAMQPSAGADGAIYYSGLGKGGFDIYRLAPAHEFEPVAVPSSKPVLITAPESEKPTPSSPYTPWRRLQPAWWFPSLVLTEGQSEIGVSTGGSDALNRHIYALTAAYDFENDIPLGAVSYVYDRWAVAFKLNVLRTTGIFVTDAGDVERVRTEDSVSAEAVLPFLKYNRQWAVHAGAVSERDRDEWRVFGATTRQTDNLGGLGLTFNSARSYPQSISMTRGRQMRLLYENSDVFRGDYNGEIYTLDWREFLPLGGRHVLAARVATGWGTESPRPFRLGGVDADLGLAGTGASLGSFVGGQLFNQREYALRGYPEGLAELRGRRMAIAALEWRFPLLQVERSLMAPPLGIRQIHGSIFYNAGSAWQSRRDTGRFSRGAGLELNTDLLAGYLLELRLRLGWAHGYDAGGEDQFYLSVGTAF